MKTPTKSTAIWLEFARSLVFLGMLIAALMVVMSVPPH